MSPLRTLYVTSAAFCGLAVTALLGCGAVPIDDTTPTAHSLLGGPGPAQIVVSTSPKVSERCPAELAATYCTPADLSAATESCRRRLTLDVTLTCSRAGCLLPYAAYRDTCTAGPTYPTASACTTPIVDDCAFYRTCLESAHPCGASGYAIGFGERMCYAFIARRTEFSPAGQAWLRGVRSCLQRSLVPLLPASTVACGPLGDIAYASHAGCYTAPDNTICALPFSDVLALANVLSLDLLDPRAIRQMGEVAKTCWLSTAPSTDPIMQRRAAQFRELGNAARDAATLQRYVRSQDDSAQAD